MFYYTELKQFKSKRATNNPVFTDIKRRYKVIDILYCKQTFVDVNASYAFTQKWRFYVEANNITNQPLRYYQGISEQTFQQEYYNVRINAGVKFDFFGK